MNHGVFVAMARKHIYISFWVWCAHPCPVSKVSTQGDVTVKCPSGTMLVGGGIREEPRMCFVPVVATMTVKDCHEFKALKSTALNIKSEPYDNTLYALEPGYTSGESGESKTGVQKRAAKKQQTGKPNTSPNPKQQRAGKRTPGPYLNQERATKPVSVKPPPRSLSLTCVV